MADTLRKEPVIASDFSLYIGTQLVASFEKVDFDPNESEVVTIRQTGKDGKQVLMKTVGANKLKDGTFKATYAAVTGPDEIYNWRKLVINGQMSEARRNCSLVAHTVDGREAFRWNFTNCFPSLYKMTGVATKTNEAIKVEVTFHFEGHELVAAGAA